MEPDRTRNDEDEINRQEVASDASTGDEASYDAAASTHKLVERDVDAEDVAAQRAAGASRGFEAPAQGAPSRPTDSDDSSKPPAELRVVVEIRGGASKGQMGGNPEPSGPQATDEATNTEAEPVSPDPADLATINDSQRMETPTVSQPSPLTRQPILSAASMGTMPSRQLNEPVGAAGASGTASRSEPAPSEGKALPLALPVMVRGVDGIILKVVAAAAPKIASACQETSKQAVRDQQRWEETERRRLGRG